MVNSIEGMNTAVAKLDWTDAFIDAVNVAAASQWDAVSRTIVSPDALPDVAIRVCLPAEKSPYVWFRCKNVAIMSLPFSYELDPVIEHEPRFVTLVWNREDKLTSVRCESIVIDNE